MHCVGCFWPAMAETLTHSSNNREREFKRKNWLSWHSLQCCSAGANKITLCATKTDFCYCRHNLFIFFFRECYFTMSQCPMMVNSLLFTVSALGSIVTEICIFCDYAFSMRLSGVGRSCYGFTLSIVAICKLYAISWCCRGGDGRAAKSHPFFVFKRNVLKFF